jgi:hypothetical protein
MKTTIILLTIVGLSTLGRGWAAESSTARAPHENHALGARTSDTLHGGREPRERNSLMGAAPSIHLQPKPLSTRSPQFQIKRAASAAAPRSGLKLNKVENRPEPVFAKLPETGTRISPKPVIGHAAAAVGHLPATSLKHNTAALNGTSIKRRF